MDENSKPKLTVVFIKQGFIGSLLSNIKKFGFILGSFAVNEYYINSNGWVEFILFIMFFLYVFSLVLTKDKENKTIKTLTVKKKQDALDFINKWCD